ncbi:MAG: L-lactate permease [Bilophila wadsworthia]
MKYRRFRTPVAITAAMLAGIGFNPLYAAGLCLIANTAPVAFGAIGVPVIVAGQVSGFDPNLISAIVGRQLPFLSVIVPLRLCVTMCGFKRSMEVLPAILVAGLCFAISQFVFSNYHGPTLPDIMSAIITLVGLVILLRFWKPATIWRFEGEKPTVLTGKGYSFGEVIRAWIPFIILAVMVFFWGLPQFKAFLDGISGSIATKGFAWPMLDGTSAAPCPSPAETPMPHFQIRLALRGRNRHPAVRLLRRPFKPGTASARPWPASSPRFTSSFRPDHRHHPRFGLMNHPA